MIIIVYTPSNSANIEQTIGKAEYSYYFVLREFLPILRELGDVIEIDNPETDVDPIYLKAKSQGIDCLFLSFSPPHKTFMDACCPTIPVLAWEFDDIPSESWDDIPQNDWRLVLGKLGLAITHSSHSVETIRKAMRENYPAISIPSPVWDRFRPADLRPRSSGYFQDFLLQISGTVIDTHADNFDPQIENNLPNYVTDHTELHLSGVVYTSVLNPLDGRKNWTDMLSAFCWAFKDKSDAVLILKFSTKHNREWPNQLQEVLADQPSFDARIIIIRGYLDDDSYKTLLEKTSFAVNSSKGEGQCLPLMEYMSAGAPAIAPNHTGMADYVTNANSFLVASSLEPVAWPDDTRKLYRTTQRRIDWESLRDSYIASYNIAKHNPQEYSTMSENAIESTKKHCSRSTAKKKLVRLLNFHKQLCTSSNLL